MMPRTGLVYDDKMLLHETGAGHPERPERLSAVADAIDRARLDLITVPITKASDDDLLRVHAWEHVEEIRQTCAAGGTYPDPDTPMSLDSWEAALIAAGGVISACGAVLDGECDNAFCAVRPPGHHAERDRAMGFCLFNNIAIAARWLQQTGRVKRIAILDWDVHHGNGTQQAFYDDPSVYFVSLHQHPLYPGTGWPSERGARQTNLNIQMRGGFGPLEWLTALETVAVPELIRFAPDFLLISAGFDSHRLDPLGSQRLEADTFAQMTRIALTISPRVVSTLEGGYHLEALGESAVAHLHALRDG
jgi:acetoin utilization deacetylase AcuC-like enzyme